MAYSEKIVERFENPTHAGSLDKDDPNVGTSLSGAPACGDVLKLQIKVDPETNLITEARWKGFGCGSLMASSQLTCEMLEGKDLEQAAAIENSELVHELNLPPAKIHCSVLAREGIQGAIEDLKRKRAARQDK